MRLGKGLRIKARELRQRSNKELIDMLSDIDIQIAKFRGIQHQEGGVIKQVGMFQTLKRNKAIILTVLTEKGIRR